MSGITVDVMNEEIMLGAWNWFDELLKADPKLSAGSFVLIEVMQPVSGSGFKKSPWFANFHNARPSFIRSNRVLTVHGHTRPIVTYCS